MVLDLVLKALIALAPVLILLLVFDRLDVFNLIPIRDIAMQLLAGSALALLSYLANWSIIDGFPIGWSAYSRYVAPVIEESMKAAPVLLMFVRNRLGYKLDAAIAGFAVGGAALVAAAITIPFAAADDGAEENANPVSATLTPACGSAFCGVLVRGTW